MGNNVLEPIKSTLATASSKVLIASVVLGPFAVIGLIWLANSVLPIEDAKAFKAPIFAIWGTIASGSGIGVVVSSLMARWGKITTQRDQIVEPLKAKAIAEVASKIPRLEPLASRIGTFGFSEPVHGEPFIQRSDEPENLSILSTHEDGQDG